MALALAPIIQIHAVWSHARSCAHLLVPSARAHNRVHRIEEWNVWQQTLLQQKVKRLVPYHNHATSLMVSNYFCELVFCMDFDRTIARSRLCIHTHTHWLAGWPNSNSSVEQYSEFIYFSNFQIHLFHKCFLLLLYALFFFSSCLLFSLAPPLIRQSQRWSARLFASYFASYVFFSMCFVVVVGFFSDVLFRFILFSCTLFVLHICLIYRGYFVRTEMILARICLNEKKERETLTHTHAQTTYNQGENKMQQKTFLMKRLCGVVLPVKNEQTIKKQNMCSFRAIKQ